MNNNTFRLSQAQFGRTLFLLGVAMGQNTQGQGEYTRLCDVLANNTPRSGGAYEIQLTGQQSEQIGTALQTAMRGSSAGGGSPPEYSRWIGELEQVWGIRQGQGAGSR